MATISFTTTFDLTASTKKITFLDTSTGIPANYNGCFKIIDPLGITIYDNTDFSDADCDIELSNAETASQQTIAFTPVLGTYTIIYTVADAATGLVIHATQTNTYDNEYVSPTGAITQVADCVSVVFSQTDSTNYIVNGKLPSTKTIVNKLTYPVGANGGSPPTPVTTTSNTLSTNVFFNGTQTSSLVATLTYIFNDGLIVKDIVKTYKEIDVNCTYICQLKCCLEVFENTMNGYKGTNPALYSQYVEKASLVSFYKGLIADSYSCGKVSESKVNEYIQKIYSIINCTSNCDCGTDDNAQVTGIGTVIGAKGDKGDTGEKGDKGDNGLDGSSKVLLTNNVAVDSATTGNGNFQTLGTKTYTLPINTLINNGDMLEVYTGTVLVGNAIATAAIRLNSTDIATVGSNSNSLPFYELHATITKVSDTSVFITYKVMLFNTNRSLASTFRGTTVSTSVNNLISATNTISVVGRTTSPATMRSEQFTIKLLKV